MIIKNSGIEQMVTNPNTAFVVIECPIPGNAQLLQAITVFVIVHTSFQELILTTSGNFFLVNL